MLIRARNQAVNSWIRVRGVIEAGHPILPVECRQLCLLVGQELLEDGPTKLRRKMPCCMIQSLFQKHKKSFTSKISHP